VDSITQFGQLLSAYDPLRILEAVPRWAHSALDLGCGDGYLSYLLAKRGIHVTAVDVSLTRLEKFRDIARAYGITQIQADVRQTGLSSGSFDLVICSEVLEHIPDYHNVLKEAYRILKDEGHMIITVPYKENLKPIVCPHCLKVFYQDGHLHRFDRRNLARKLKNTGFEIRRQKTFRSRGVVHLQHHLRLRYGALLRALDAIFSKLLPEWTFYLFIEAVKKGRCGPR